MYDQEQTHEQNLNANKTTAMLIAEGKSGFDIEIAMTVNELTRRLCQHRGISIKEAKMSYLGQDHGEKEQMLMKERREVREDKHTEQDSMLSSLIFGGIENLVYKSF